MGIDAPPLPPKPVSPTAVLMSSPKNDSGSNVSKVPFNGRPSSVTTKLNIVTPVFCSFHLLIRSVTSSPLMPPSLFVSAVASRALRPGAFSSSAPETTPSPFVSYSSIAAWPAALASISGLTDPCWAGIARRERHRRERRDE